MADEINILQSKCSLSESFIAKPGEDRRLPLYNELTVSDVALRDMFAGMAMQMTVEMKAAIPTESVEDVRLHYMPVKDCTRPLNPEEIAEYSYRLADAMMKARREQK